MLTHFSLFTGIGGIDLAAEWAGFTTVGQCEYAPYPTKILEKHWPDVPRWRDVRDVTAESIRERGIGEITLLSGGFPCQPHSLAGKRKASADERDLWPEFRRVISEVTPRWVLGENVPGLFSSDDRRFFGRILNDLAQMGYSVGWATYGASDVGANHKRDRVFIVAHSISDRRRESGARELAASSENVAHANNSGNRTQGPNVDENGKTKNEVWKKQPQRRVGGLCENVANSDSESGLQTGSPACPIGGKWNPRNNACWSCGGCEPGADWWSVEPGIRRVANGIPHRVDRLKCLGNAVVPQQVYPILKAIADIERMRKDEQIH